jgi:hypothetical protein
MDVKIQASRRGTFIKAFWASLSSLADGTCEEIRGFSRHPFGLTCEVDGKTVWIWSWDYDYGVRYMLDNNLADLILHVQYGSIKDDKVKPFTMFPSGHVTFFAGLEAWREIKSEKTHKLGFSGRVWRNRKRWFQKADYSEPTRGQATGFGTFEDYVKKLKSWEKCLILAGKGSKVAMSNRREVECAALGVPMVLNYQPTYYRDFSKCYHFVKTPDDIDKLDGYPQDYWDELAKNALDFYENNMSPEGIRSVFTQACTDFFGK